MFVYIESRNKFHLKQCGFLVRTNPKILLNITWEEAE